MGLIKAAAESVSRIFADQWREYFYCDAMPENVLMVKGKKRINANSSNTKGAENVITHGSTIVVNEGQCMMIVEQGAIVEFAAEAGAYTFDSKTEATIFYGGLGQGIKGSWETFKRRFTFGGDTGMDQRVYYFNLKEIMGNLYGTSSPIPYRVVDRNIGLDMDTQIRCNGEYSYKITDPILFYKNVCGNETESYTRDRLDRTMKAEFVTALQPALGKLSAQGIRFSEIISHTEDLAQAMNEALTKKWSGLRGISVASVAMNPPSLPPEIQKKLTDMQTSARLRDPGLAAAHMIEAQATAMNTAAGNEGGAMMGFMGMNMAQMAGGMNANQLFQMSAQQPAAPAPVAPAPAPVAPAAAANSWTCACGMVNTGKFCTDCGASKPADGWTCACGAVNKGKFCPECGAKKPAAEPLYRCDKCGWEPADPKNPPKFCPECGDRFDDSDIK